MTTDALALIATIVSLAVGATWVLRSSLMAIEAAMREHAVDDTRQFGDLTKRVVSLEAARRKRQGK